MTLWLRLKAPFAAYRYFQAGVYRATSPIMPHSAAWGLLLNIAGIEARINQDLPITEIDPNAPKLEIALGAVTFPERCSLYQQLHSYPVGSSGKEFASRTKGAKYWIAPVRREILVGLDTAIGVRTSDAALLDRIRRGLSGQLDVPRYGLPFAGDNNFMFDEISITPEASEAYWYKRVQEEDPPSRNSCRLTVGIDRLDSSKSTSYLFAPTARQSTVPPEDAWICTPCGQERVASPTT